MHYSPSDDRMVRGKVRLCPGKPDRRDVGNRDVIAVPAKSGVR